MQVKQQASTTPPCVPLLMRHAQVEQSYPFKAPNFSYDPDTQTTADPEYRCGGESSGCTKATYSTPKVGKDPEGDYAADD